MISFFVAKHGILAKVNKSSYRSLDSYKKLVRKVSLNIFHFTILIIGGWRYITNHSLTTYLLTSHVHVGKQVTGNLQPKIIDKKDFTFVTLATATVALLLSMMLFKMSLP